MSEARTLLIEIGVEDLPPALIETGAAFADVLSGLLREENFLRAAEPPPETCCTPRRIAAKLQNVATHQPKETIERKGPRAERIDKDDPATRGFAKSCGVAIERLKLRDGRLFCLAETGGRTLGEVLPALLPAAASRMPIPRRMRWGDGEHAFARPVHRLCVLHGDEVIPCELFGIKAGRAIGGHRHHCPEPLELRTADEYETRLKEQGRVIVQFGERAAAVERQVGNAAGAGLSIVSDTMLHETAATTEWPHALNACFDEAFLSLPREVIEQTLEHALKVFVLQDEKARLSSRFVIVADVESNDPQTIVRGYETIVRARLEDARFFFEQDKKTSLEARRAMLKRTLFQEKLGALADKAKRLETLAASLAPRCGASPERTKRAAQLCKCDLGCDLVGEYPKLQGIMGGYYAEADGEDAAVATAIREHYLPLGRGDVPTSPEGATLALCDKADTLAGFWLAGLTPSGSKDPYGLHRAATGILRIVIHGGFDLGLEELIAEAVSGYDGLFKRETRDAARADLAGYLRNQLHDPVFVWSLAGHQDKDTDQINAVAAASGEKEAAQKPIRPLDFIRRLGAVAAFTRDAAVADSLIAANKRIRNILKKTGLKKIEEAGAGPDETTITEDAERGLLEAVNARRDKFERLYAEHDYIGAMQTLAELREPVDRFFDEVLVMAEDERQRANRLALLHHIMRLFLKIADLSELNSGKTLRSGDAPDVRGGAEAAN